MKVQPCCAVSCGILLYPPASSCILIRQVLCTGLQCQLERLYERWTPTCQGVLRHSASSCSHFMLLTSLFQHLCTPLSRLRPLCSPLRSAGDTSVTPQGRHRAACARAAAVGVCVRAGAGHAHMRKVLRVYASCDARDCHHVTTSASYPRRRRIRNGPSRHAADSAMTSS